jgi:hypothetical protein
MYPRNLRVQEVHASSKTHTECVLDLTVGMARSVRALAISFCLAGVDVVSPLSAVLIALKVDRPDHYRENWYRVQEALKAKTDADVRRLLMLIHG